MGGWRGVDVVGRRCIEEKCKGRKVVCSGSMAFHIAMGWNTRSK